MTLLERVEAVGAAAASVAADDSVLPGVGEG
jgi:hypothetical protein